MEKPNLWTCMSGLTIILAVLFIFGLFLCAPRTAKEILALSNDLPEKTLGQPKSEKVALRVVQPLSEATKDDVPQPIEPKPIPLVGPSDGNWLLALRIYETGEDCWAVGDSGKSKGEYQIQEGRWNDALDRIGMAHDDYEWRWDLWYWNRAKAEYVLYSYWARYKLNTWEQRVKAHKGIAGIDNPSRKVYYERVKNIAYDLMRRGADD